MINRRDFIRLGAAGTVGLLIGIPLPGRSSTTSSFLHPLIQIKTNGDITLFAQNPEMGQGVKTSLPMIIAEELDVDWKAIEIGQADWDSRLENQFSGGSLSIRLNYEAMRKAGATARAMLVMAAAKRLGQDAAALTTRNGFVIDDISGSRLSYGELALEAAALPVPQDPPMKKGGQFHLVGKSVSDVDQRAIVSGAQVYSLDVKLPGMLYAKVVRCPHPDGQPLSYDDREASAVPGVTGFHLLRNSDHGGRILMPNCPNFVSGVAVLANNTWAAMEGARKLKVQWQLPDSRDDSETLMRQFEQALSGELETVRSDGDIQAEGAVNSIDVSYGLPFVAHIPMEPMNCTALVKEGQAEVWAPTQNPPMAAEAVARILGIEQADVTVHVMRSGGAFGRRYYPDFVTDTVLLSRQFERPVKVIWSREDDIRYDYFRPASVQRVCAATGPDGRISHWRQQVASHPRNTYLERDGSPAEIANYEFPAGFVSNLSFEYVAVPARVPLGQWRATEHSSNVFVVSSAIDELAHAAGADPLAFWLKLVGHEQFVQVREDFRFDASRLRRVIELAAERSGWGKSLPDGKGLGISASYNQGAWVAEVAEVTARKGSFKVDRITCAVDCGRIINPQGAHNQVAGGIIDGLSTALHGRITVKDGMVEQSNFHDYRISRIGRIPEIDIHFVHSDDAPRGLGEGPLPPVAPAVCNALFAATGSRIRSLPIRYPEGA
jgi:isoquinoline 1-oxidoreductase beta subunit